MPGPVLGQVQDIWEFGAAHASVAEAADAAERAGTRPGGGSAEAAQLDTCLSDLTPLACRYSCMSLLVACFTFYVLRFRYVLLFVLLSLCVV